MIKVGDLKTLKDIILKKCDEYASNVAFLEKDKVTKKFEEITYAKLKEDTMALATTLVSKYKLQGKKVAVIGENSYKWYVSYLAATTGVGIIVPLDKELPANEIENLLNRSKAGCIIYSSKKEDVILEIKKKVSKDVIYINMDKEKSDEESLSFLEVIEEGKKYIAKGDTSYIDYEYSAEDFKILLREGADKISINSAAIMNPNLISEAAEKFGSQCVVVAIDAKRRADGSGFNIYKHGGRLDMGIDAVEWAMKAEKLGAGEILLTSMDGDGTKAGYDLELTRQIAENVKIPVIASGGAGKLEHFKEALTVGKADAALAASLFHFKELEIRQVKEYLRHEGVSVRL